MLHASVAAAAGGLVPGLRTSAAAAFPVLSSSVSNLIWLTVSMYNHISLCNTKLFCIRCALLICDRTEKKVLSNIYRNWSARDRYLSCSAQRPVSVALMTGSDTVRLNGAGERYFICGAPGHCAAGMKLQVRVISGGRRRVR